MSEILEDAQPDDLAIDTPIAFSPDPGAARSGALRCATLSAANVVDDSLYSLSLTPVVASFVARDAPPQDKYDQDAPEASNSDAASAGERLMVPRTAAQPPSHARLVEARAGSLIPVASQQGCANPGMFHEDDGTGRDPTGDMEAQQGDRVAAWFRDGYYLGQIAAVVDLKSDDYEEAEDGEQAVRATYRVSLVSHQDQDSQELLALSPCVELLPLPQQA